MTSDCKCLPSLETGSQAAALKLLQISQPPCIFSCKQWARRASCPRHPEAATASSRTLNDSPSTKDVISGPRGVVRSQRHQNGTRSVSAVGSWNHGCKDNASSGSITARKNTNAPSFQVTLFLPTFPVLHHQQQRQLQNDRRVRIASSEEPMSACSEGSRSCSTITLPRPALDLAATRES